MFRLKSASGHFRYVVNYSLTFALFFVIFLSSFDVWAEESQAGLTLPQALEQGFASNPEISRAINSQKATQEQLYQARELYLPSLSMTADGGYESTMTPRVRETELYHRRVSLTLTQPIFNGFGTVNELRKRKARTDQAESNSIKTSELAALNMVDDFLSVLKRRALLEEARKSVDDHLDIYGKIKDGAAAGRFNQGDLSQVKSRLSRSRATLDAAVQSLAEAEASYAKDFGVAAPSVLAVPGFQDSLLPATEGELLDQAKENNPVLAGFRADVKAAEADYNGQKSSFLPDVSLQMSGSRGIDVGGAVGNEKLGSALVVMRWDLFKGGSDVARVKEAYYRKAAAGDGEQQALRSLENDVRSAWAARVAAKSQLEELQSQVRANRRVVEAYRDQFRLNRRSLIDLLNAQSELFTSKSGQINLFYNSVFSGYQLLALKGDLVKTLVPEKMEEKQVVIEAAKADVPPPAAVIEPKAGDETSAAPVIKQMTEIKKARRGSRFVQLGSYHTLPELEERWKILQEGAPDLLQGLERIVQDVDLGAEGVYHRLRVGPVTKSAGRALCDMLGGRNLGGCIIVKP